MSVRAQLRFFPYSATKVRLLADVIRGMDVEQAQRFLDFSPKRTAPALAKLLRSAVANAEQRGDMDVEILYVAKTAVNNGTFQTRGVPRARGRFFTIRRESCHVMIELNERTSAPAAKGKKKAD